MKIAICFIGTGKYINLLPNYYNTINQYFIPECEKHFFVFTDGDIEDSPDNMTVYHVDDKVRPYNHDDNMYKSVGGLYRFDTIYDKVEDFKDYDWFVYIDSDYYCCSENISYDEYFNDEKPFFGILHPTFTSYWSKFVGYLPHEKNKNSWAYVDDSEHDDTYVQGCMWGGKVPQVLDMILELKEHTINDLENNIIPRAQDEAYLNRFRLNNLEDFHIVHPSFGKPGNLPDSEFSFKAKMVHCPEYRNEVLK